MEGSSHPKVTHYHPIPAMTANTDYVTRDFVRRDCSIHGAELSDRDGDRLAADGAIHPTFPETR